MQMRKSQTEPARPELVSIVKPDSPSNRLELVSIVLARKAGWRIFFIYTALTTTWHEDYKWHINIR